MHRRVPLWHFAALPHTPQLRFWFLLFAVVGVVCVGSGAVRQLGPVYARHSAGDTNKPEAAQTQSGGETIRTGPFAVLVVSLARISCES
jgi:hypothetical protein